MKFINLVTMDFADRDDCYEVSHKVHVNPSWSIVETREKIAQQVKEKWSKFDAAEPYHFNYSVFIKQDEDEPLSEEEFSQMAEYYINVIESELMTNLIKPEKAGRPRERRLDVPENLKRNIYVNNTALIKNMLNYQTYINIFTITMNFTLEYAGNIVDNDMKLAYVLTEGSGDNGANN